MTESAVVGPQELHHLCACTCNNNGHRNILNGYIPSVYSVEVAAVSE